MSYCPRDHIIAEIGHENYYPFLEWAFGPDFSENITDLRVVPELWSKLHPNHIIDVNEEMHIGIGMMIEEYRKSGLMARNVLIEVKEND